MLPEDLMQVVLLSGLAAEPKPPNHPTAAKVVRYRGTAYKVRKYAHAGEARRQEELLSVTKELFARCYGRVDNYLIFRYLDDHSEPPHSTNHLSELGDFLGELSAIPSSSPTQEFETWISEMSSSNIFRPATIHLVKQYYQSCTDRIRIPWGIEYFDAMPRNFVLNQAKLISIDEKHLRVGPKGVSLIRPMWELSADNFETVLESYKARTGFSGFDDKKYREFLVFYFIVFGLAFVSTQKSRKVNIQIPAFHSRRHQLLKIVGAPMSSRVREQAWWLLLHATYRLGSLLTRTPVAIAYWIVSRHRIRLSAQVNNDPLDRSRVVDNR